MSSFGAMPDSNATGLGGGEAAAASPPNSALDLLSVPWFAQPDDLIGGWCVMTVDKPPSQADHRTGEVQVGDFLGEDVARHVASLHNVWLAEWGRP